MITERQEKILDRIAHEYIKSAQPVSSQLLGKKYKMGFSTATIRNDMQKLTEEGLLFQPHTSAGRVPTDKGYRFLVDKISAKKSDDFDIEMKKKFKDKLDFIREVTKYLALESSGLALGYLEGEEVLWKEGWGDVLKEPEFSQPGLTLNFAKMLDDFEKEFGSFISETPEEIKVYIGKENPFSEIRDFSIVTAGVFTILGPKRMHYDKNINLLDSIIKWQKKI